MRVLVVSWYMPPRTTMGSLRVGKLCKYLVGQGHDIRVVSALPTQPLPRGLATGFDDRLIVRTRWMDINAPVKGSPLVPPGFPPSTSAPTASAPEPSAPEGGGEAGPKEAPVVPAAPAGRLRRFARAVDRWYRDTTNVPDPQVGWYPFALGASRRLLDGWKPDVVFASAPPFTALMIGRRLARWAGAPWIAEYRDRFLEDPYSQRSWFAQCRDAWLENHWLRGVAGLVTVSEPWAEEYRARLGVPVATVFNGFDPDDFPADYPRRATDPAVLRIVYTGVLYTDRRDPSPLFAALARMPERDAVRVEFYGADPASLRAMAERHGVVDRVGINGRIPYTESIDVQMNADVLLLLQWNNPLERGNVPGKLFEYLGARRPVLGLGVEDGVPARILRERDAGVVVNDPDAIAGHLRAWIAEKRAKGCIPLLPMAARDGLARDEQYAVTERMMREAIGRARGKP